MEARQELGFFLQTFSLEDWMVLMKPIESLKWPEDRWRLALLSIQELQTWYAAQDAKDMIFLANTQDFKRFWHFAYILPVRFYRFLLKIKRNVNEDHNNQVSEC